MVWYPVIAKPGAAEMVRGLQSLAPRGWLHARLQVQPIDPMGFGLAGSGVLVINPPYTLHTDLQTTLPWLAQALGRRARGEPPARTALHLMGCDRMHALCADHGARRCGRRAGAQGLADTACRVHAHEPQATAKALSHVARSPGARLALPGIHGAAGLARLGAGRRLMGHRPALDLWRDRGGGRRACCCSGAASTASWRARPGPTRDEMLLAVGRGPGSCSSPGSTWTHRG